MKAFLKLLISICVFVAFFYVSNANSQFLFFRNPLAGKPAEDFTLKTIKGTTVNFSNYRENKNAVIFFWATWCPHCRKAIMQLSEDMAQLESQDIRILVVDVGEQKEEVVSFLNRVRISNLNVLLDQSGEIAQGYFITGFPSFVFVNKDGTVKTVQHVLPEHIKTIFGD